MEVARGGSTATAFRVAGAACTLHSRGPAREEISCFMDLS